MTPMSGQTVVASPQPAPVGRVGGGIRHHRESSGRPGPMAITILLGCGHALSVGLARRRRRRHRRSLGRRRCCRGVGARCGDDRHPGPPGVATRDRGRHRHLRRSGAVAVGRRFRRGNRRRRACRRPGRWWPAAASISPHRCPTVVIGGAAGRWWPVDTSSPAVRPSWCTSTHPRSAPAPCSAGVAGADGRCGGDGLDAAASSEHQRSGPAAVGVVWGAGRWPPHGGGHRLFRRSPAGPSSIGGRRRRGVGERCRVGAGARSFEATLAFARPAARPHDRRRRCSSAGQPRCTCSSSSASADCPDAERARDAGALAGRRRRSSRSFALPARRRLEAFANRASTASGRRRTRRCGPSPAACRAPCRWTSCCCSWPRRCARHGARRRPRSGPAATGATSSPSSVPDRDAAAAHLGRRGAHRRRPGPRVGQRLVRCGCRRCSTAATARRVRVAPVAHLGELLGLIVAERPADDTDSTRTRTGCSASSPARSGSRCTTCGSTPRCRQPRRAAACATPSSQRLAARIVAAADESRRRIERNLHDGAQQHLVAMAVKLGLARQLLDADPAHGGDDARGAARRRAGRRSPSCASWPTASTRRCCATAGCPRRCRPPANRAVLPTDGRSPTSSAAIEPSRGGGLLLLPRGDAERRQARRRGRVASR